MRHLLVLRTEERSQAISRDIDLDAVSSVEIGADSVKIDVSRDRLAALLGSEHEEVAHNEPIDPSGHILTLTAPVQLTRVGREMKLLVDDSNDHRSPDMSLLRVLTRAHDVQRRLAEDTALGEAPLHIVGAREDTQEA